MYDLKAEFRCKCVPAEEEDSEDAGNNERAGSGGRNSSRNQSIRKGKWPEGCIDISEFGEFVLKGGEGTEGMSGGGDNQQSPQEEDVNDWTFVLKDNVLYILLDEFDIEPMYALDVSQYFLYTSPTMNDRYSFKLAHSTCVSYFLKASRYEEFHKWLNTLSLIVDDSIHLS